MAKPEINEEEEEEEEKEKSPPPPPPPPTTTTTTTPPLPKPPTPPSSSPQTALTFWFYLTLSISLLTLLLSSLPPLQTPSHRTWFLSLPDHLRAHYSAGKLIKVHPTPASPPLRLFAAEAGPRSAPRTLLLLPGLASTSFSFRRVLSSLSSAGLRVVALDFPGSGFSDCLDRSQHGRWGFLIPGWLRDVYGDIRDKGLFWGFDQLVEKGHIPFDESERIERKKGREGLGYGPVEMAKIVGQVVDSMALGKVDLVIHDSALGAGANWVSRNSELVSSITLIDSAAESAAFPSWMLGVPVFGEVVLGSRWLFRGLLRLCCSRKVDESAAEGYRLLLKGKDGRRATVEAGKGLNYSFDLGEWVESEEVRGLPLMVLWSGSWSDRWIDQGREAAKAVSWGKFAYHSGGRWPQEDAAEEIASVIAQFVFSLPKASRQTEVEPLPPQHIQKIFDKASSDDHHHRHEGHGPEHAAGYPGMYGFGQGWGL